MIRKRHNIIATALAVVFAVPVIAAALSLTVDIIESAAVVGAAVAAVAGYWIREAYRELHHRRLMREIERDPRYAIGSRPSVAVAPVALTKREAAR